MDFDFDFDFGSFGTEYNRLDICGLIQKMKSKSKKRISIRDEVKQIEQIMPKMPGGGETFKLISVCGGFSSISIISFVARTEGIEELTVSTFRIGKKQFSEICSLHDSRKIGKVGIITSSTQREVDEALRYNGETYNYFNFINKKCEENGWTIKTVDNHSKLILMRTRKNFYVVETSSNLNENPKMEQFSIENDEPLYNWYKEILEELMRTG